MLYRRWLRRTGPAISFDPDRVIVLPASCAERGFFICLANSPERRQMHPEFRSWFVDRPSIGPGAGVPRLALDQRFPPLTRIDRPEFLAGDRCYRMIPRMREMKLQDLKSKTPTELLTFAEE